METAVICTTFNKAQQVKRNIWCMAHQDYPLDDFVLIMVDDGSADNTQEVLEESFEKFFELNVISILTHRKPKDFFGGMGLAVNIGLRYAEELGVEYVFLTGGDILWPTYAISSHIKMHKDPLAISWALTGSTDYNVLTDVMIGQRQYFIRPDRESLGNDSALLASIPDRYDWKPPEKLQSQPEALTIETFTDGDYIYLGFPGDMPCDISHPTWPNLQSCKLIHWLNIGGYDEAGTGHCWEDVQLEKRLALYAKEREENNIFPRFTTVTHPFAECYHQPHPRQLSHDNRSKLMQNIERFGYNVNKGQYLDWGRSEHIIVMERI